MSGIARAQHRAFEAGKGEMPIAAAKQWPGQWHNLGVAKRCRRLDARAAGKAEPEQLAVLSNASPAASSMVVASLR